jgi:hypothetical protein
MRVFFGTGIATAIAWLIAIKITRHPFWDEVCLIAGKFANRTRNGT